MVATHKGAVILALLASIIVASPQLFLRIDHRSDGIYQGIELLPDNPWSPRIREVMDGHGFGSIYYKDSKNDPYIFQPLGSTVVAYIGKVFSLEINNTLLASRAILSFIAYLLIYSFVFVLSRDKLVALCGASLLVLADAVMNLSGLARLIQGISPANFLSISQPANPAMILIPFFGFLVSFWFFYTKRDWRLGVLSAFLLGLNFYNYFYSWTYLYAFGGILVLLYLVQKKWSEAVRLGSVFLGALVVAIPYVINLNKASAYPIFTDISMRLGIVLTHTPLWVGSMVIAALGIFLVGFPRKDGGKYLFGLALLLTPFITMNQQLFTGKEMQAAHYHWYFHKPMAILFIVMTGFYVLAWFQKRFSNELGRLNIAWLRPVFAALIIVASFATGVFVQAASYYSGPGDGGSVAVERQKYGPVMQWLNQSAVKEEVVLANDPVSYAVAVYTPLNVYYHRAALYSLSATEERLLDTIFTFYRLRGVDSKNVRQVFFAERAYISANLYGIYYRQFAGSYEAIPDEELNRMASLYENTFAAPASVWLKQILTKYEVNYIVWDKKANPDWQVQKYPFFKEAAVFGDLGIYRFQQ